MLVKAPNLAISVARLKSVQLFSTAVLFCLTRIANVLMHFLCQLSRRPHIPVARQ